MSKTDWKVFEFVKKGYTYTIKAKSKEEARQYLADELDIKIKNCIEIQESEWDKPSIKVYEDNNTDNEPYFMSIREAFHSKEAELICTNDWSLFD